MTSMSTNEEQVRGADHSDTFPISSEEMSKKNSVELSLPYKHVDCLQSYEKSIEKREAFNKA